MIFVHDARIQQQAIISIKKFGVNLPFITQQLTFDELSGHPDIFICQSDDVLIVAPNVPDSYIDFFEQKDIKYCFGYKNVGKEKVNSSAYNAVVTKKYVFHNKNITDKKILELNADKEYIHVNQAYTRCSLFPLPNNNFITSDKGIAKTLEKMGLGYFLLSADDIMLPGYRNGCAGGCFGYAENKIYMTGDIAHHSEGKALKEFIENCGCELIELYAGKLFDGGSLIII